MENREDAETEGGEDEEVEEEKESDVFERSGTEVVRDLEKLCRVGFGITSTRGIESGGRGGFGEKRGGGGRRSRRILWGRRRLQPWSEI